MTTCGIARKKAPNIDSFKGPYQVHAYRADLGDDLAVLDSTMTSLQLTLEDIPSLEGKVVVLTGSSI
jgi:hypothetical protein